jgi:D-apionolactonase
MVTFVETFPVAPSSSYQMSAPHIDLRSAATKAARLPASKALPRLWIGRDELAPDPVELRAGPVTAWLYEGDLRHVRLGGVELAQRVYVAVRDAVWNTIPATIEDLEVRSKQESFEVTFSCRHRHQEIDFRWRAQIVGEPQGAITYRMDGASRSRFSYAKIGLNIHHPLRECVGRPYRAYRDGRERRGELPVDIEPQLFLDGQLTALFPEYEAIVIDLEGGLEVRFDFEGDLFEMQDHRNWTDANLKSYGTPLSLPWPFDAEPGQEIRQSVRISTAGPRPAQPPARTAVPVELGEVTELTLPPIGLGTASHRQQLSDREVALLAAVAPAHLRVDLVLDDEGLERRLDAAVQAATALGAALELAVFTGEAKPEEASRIDDALRSDPVAVARVLVFAGGEGFSSTSGTTTPAAMVRGVRAALSSVPADVPFAGGTNQFFTELNRNRPEAGGMDGIAYSINPQVHASDDFSLMENLEDQPDTVAMARKLTNGLPVFVTPVTLIGRYGPFPAGPPSPDDLPGNVDVRHGALFGAAWTVGSVKQLSAAGAASVTFYETSGPTGLIHRDGGMEHAELFPFEPGLAFPLYHVLADIGGDGAGRLVDARSGDPLSVEVLALSRGDGLELLLANLTRFQQPVSLTLPRPYRASLRALDAATAERAMRDPEGFRSDENRTDLGVSASFKFDLAPFAVLRLDATAADGSAAAESPHQ